MEQERVWDFTSVNLFQTCRKKYQYRIIKGLVPLTTAPALEFGKAIHLALETYYKEVSAGAKEIYQQIAIERSIKAFQESYKDREGELKRTVENGVKLLNGYFEVYKNEPFTIISQEVGFAVPLEYLDHTGTSKSILLCGRLDALVDWNGVLYVLEHKTTTVLGSYYFNQFEMSHQLDGYIYGASQHTGRKCLGAIVNALEVWKDVAKPTSKTKTMEEHYARDPISRSDQEINDYKQDFGQTVEDILDAEKKNRFPRTKSACFSYNYKCPYWQLCKYGEDEKVLARDYKIEPWVPYKTGDGENE